jgi:fatty acid desaturase
MAEQLTRNDVVGRARALKDSGAVAPIREILLQWLQVFCALALFYIYPFWWVYIPVVLFVSARQYALAVMLHDGQHTLLHPDKTINRFLGKWLLAAPLGTTFADSQKIHLDHHYHLGSPERDPDYALYCFGDPVRKQSIFQLIVLLSGKFIGEKVIHLLKRDIDTTDSRAQAGREQTGSPHRRSLALSLIDFVLRRWSVVVVQAILLTALTFVFGWYGYFALWILPLATLTALYNDFRIFCEHSLIGRDTNNPDERLATFISNPIERFFIAPNHMNYHAEHHFFPYVPHRNLPALREAIRQCPEWNDRIEWRKSYFGHLGAYISGFRQSRVQTPSDGGERAGADNATQRL